MAENRHTVTPLPLPTVLFLVFLVLKLTGNIAWSWWWITSPLWIAVLVAVPVLTYIEYQKEKQRDATVRALFGRK